MLADKLGRIGAAVFCVTGVALWRPQGRFAWQVWHFADLPRGRRMLADKLGRIGAAVFRLTGVALWRPQGRFA